MDRNCYCCGPGGSAKMNTASQGENRGCQMDVDLALSELDSLQSVTGVNYTRGSGAVSTERTVGRHGCRMPRERSLSESISPSTHCLIRSCSESSFESESKKQTASSGDISINVNACINSKKINSAPLTQSHIVGGYHLVRRNSEFVSSIVTPYSRSQLCHWSSLPASWSYGESSGLNAGWYRDYDIQERVQRRAARLRLERSRRLRRPYLIPFRMCQSMQDEGATSLADFWLTPSSPSASTSKSNTTSPIKQDVEGNMSGTNKLVRSHSIDNLELAKLKLSDTFNGQLELAKERQAVEQVATGLQNLQMV
ncbi:uncharacterized protein LOC112562169 isoform X2 [Pomacea canaliculata]|nr:uncharacterized protein LOC112562169 isoform X2 [Pomacea canaliculata]